MLDLLGGWMQRTLPFRGRQLVTYHKNWIYFARVFGVEIMGEVEPKPGIPPSPRHVEDLIRLMRERHVPVILAANYFDEDKVRHIAAAVGATPVIVPMSVAGVPGVQDYFALVDYWIDHLARGFADADRARTGVTK
jgi:ABC-type Zn uptake system ZnuABC Zn-binding protein ZnuA